MTLEELLVRVADSFAAEEIQFLLIGGMALSTWVEPRLTRDCDIVVRVRKRNQARLKAALIRAGARVTQVEMRILYEKRWIRLRVGRLLLDVHVVATLHDRSAFEHGGEMTYQGQRLRVATPEDLVLYKLQAWRPQDWVDIRRLIEEVPRFDRRYVEAWIPRIARSTGLPLQARWAEVSREV